MAMKWVYYLVFYFWKRVTISTILIGWISLCFIVPYEQTSCDSVLLRSRNLCTNKSICVCAHLATVCSCAKISCTLLWVWARSSPSSSENSTTLIVQSYKPPLIQPPLRYRHLSSSFKSHFWCIVKILLDNNFRYKFPGIIFWQMFSFFS